MAIPKSNQIRAKLEAEKKRIQDELAQLSGFSISGRAA